MKQKGINEPTEIGFHYKIYDDTFRLKKSIIEQDGGEIYSLTALLSRKSFLQSTSHFNISGDGTVPYYSLSWCKEWQHDLINEDDEPPIECIDADCSNVKNRATSITKYIKNTIIPTTVDETSRLKGLLKMLGMEKLNYGMQRSDSTITYPNGRSLKTSVIELEHINHRDIIRHQKLLEIIKSELKNRDQGVPFYPFESKHQPDHSHQTPNNQIYHYHSKANSTTSSPQSSLFIESIMHQDEDVKCSEDEICGDNDTLVNIVVAYNRDDDEGK